MDVLFAIALPQEWKIAIVLGLLALAVVLFARETLPVDVLTLVFCCWRWLAQARFQ